MLYMRWSFLRHDINRDQCVFSKQQAYTDEDAICKPDVRNFFGEIKREINRNKIIWQKT